VEGTPDASPADESGGPDVAEPDAAPASDASGGTCTDERPQLAAADATNYTVLQYLAQAGILTAGLIKDNWDPTAGIGDVMTFTPGYSVAPTGATYTTVQGAVNAAAAQGGTSRIYIAVSPGTYRETVCLPAGAPPVTLYGTGRDPTQTAIVFGNYNGESLDGGASVNPCTSASASATTVGTAGSATVAVFANDFQAKNITFSNDVSLSTLSTTTGTQAVALMTQADRVVLDSVRVLGHQDTLYIETPGAGTVVRAYVKNSYIQGDVDFIFGGATFVLDGCQIQFVSDRKSSGQALAPSTNSRNPYGGLVVGSNFTADGNTVAGTVGLGRAWDRSCVDVPTYVSNCVASGSYPNGQAVVRDSTLGAHIGVAPWLAAATTKRPYCDTAWNCVPDGGTCPANRLFEYKNTGPGSAP
jgi:pectinesterase